VWYVRESTVAKFTNPRGVTTDGTNIYIADYSNSTIRKYQLSNGAVTTLAGVPNAYGYADGASSVAKFSAPRALVTFGGNLYTSEFNNCLVRQISLATQITSTVAGALGSCTVTDGYGTNNARVNRDYGATTDGIYIYFADTNGAVIRRFNPSNGEMITIAGLPGTSGAQDGTGSSARFNSPEGITTDGVNLYVVDTNNHAIRQVVISTYQVTTLAGLMGTAGVSDGTGTAARFNTPAGITTDNTNLYVADYGNQTIRKIVISSGLVSTIAGTAGSATFADGTGGVARFYSPYGITYDGTYLYVADYNNHAIRKVTPSGTVTTIMGAPTSTYDTVSGPIGSSFVRFPTMLQWTAQGLFIANDYGIKQLH
jgi:hypothetical protein